VEDKLPAGECGVDVLLEALKADARLFEFGHELDEVLQRSSQELSRARNSGPFVSSALAMYAEMASAAAKCSPIRRCLSPFSWSVTVASSPSWWKSWTRGRHAVPILAPL
jgi:hypothetical protein